MGYSMGHGEDHLFGPFWAGTNNPRSRERTTGPNELAHMYEKYVETSKLHVLCSQWAQKYGPTLDRDPICVTELKLRPLDPIWAWRRPHGLCCYWANNLGPNWIAIINHDPIWVPV
jgi:hypothetical protein